MPRRILRRVKVKRNCPFCQKKELPNWENPDELRRFTSERERIIAASKTGLCAKHQRKLTVAIKRARHLGLLPFVTGLK